MSCARLGGRYTREEFSKFILQEAHHYGTEKKIVFVTTDGASNAKRQIRISAEEEQVLLDIHYDPSKDDDGEGTDNDTEVDEDDLLHPLSVTDTLWADEIRDADDIFRDEFVAAMIMMNVKMEDYENQPVPYSKDLADISILSKMFDINHTSNNINQLNPTEYPDSEGQDDLDPNSLFNPLFSIVPQGSF